VQLALLDALSASEALVPRDLLRRAIPRANLSVLILFLVASSWLFADSFILALLKASRCCPAILGALLTVAIGFAIVKRHLVVPVPKTGSHRVWKSDLFLALFNAVWLALELFHAVLVVAIVKDEGAGLDVGARKSVFVALLDLAPSALLFASFFISDASLFAEANGLSHALFTVHDPDASCPTEIEAFGLPALDFTNFIKAGTEAVGLWALLEDFFALLHPGVGNEGQALFLLVGNVATHATRHLRGHGVLAHPLDEP